MEKTMQISFNVESFSMADIVRSMAGVQAVIAALYSAIALKCGQCKGSPLAAAACTDDTCPLSRFGPGCIFELPTLLEQYQAQTSQQGEAH